MLARADPGGPEDPMFAPAVKITWIRRFKRLSADLPVFGEVDGVGSQWHALRSFCAMQKAMRGYSTPRLMYEMGWSSMAMAERYINIAQAAGVPHRAKKGP